MAPNLGRAANPQVIPILTEDTPRMALHLSGAAHAPAFAALRNRDCAIYLLNSSAAMMSDSIEHIVSYWVIFHAFPTGVVVR